MNLSEVPEELQGLTDMEEMLIAQNFSYRIGLLSSLYTVVVL